jgi:hypothetical protein
MPSTTRGPVPAPPAVDESYPAQVTATTTETGRTPPSATDAGRRPGRGRFDELFRSGSAAIAAGRHQVEEPPRSGGRWGLSVVLRPDNHARSVLDELTRELLGVAGVHHWRTGAGHSSHMTVRGIQPYRDNLRTTDAIVRRCHLALQRATRDHQLLRFQFAGLTMTSTCVMACAYPVNEHPARLAANLRDELRTDAWLEEHQPRTIWYVSLLHFAGPVADPTALIRWVTARRDRALGELCLPRAQLVTFEHQPRGLSPRVLSERDLIRGH